MRRAVVFTALVSGLIAAGSFTCDTTYGNQSLTAKGTFKAR